MTRITIVSLSLLMLSWIAASGHVMAASHSKPNIILIMADDMGYGDPGCFNPKSKIPTPHIDSLAKAGMRFTDAHAPASVCVPSRYGLLTGQYPFRTRIRWGIPGTAIASDRLTVGKMLQAQGYSTACVGKWHLGFESDHPTTAGQRMPGGPLDRGFDQFFGIWASLDIPPYYYIEDDRCVLPPTGRIEASSTEGWTRIQGAFSREGGIASDFQHEDVLPVFATKAVGIIEKHAASETDDPLFLYFPLPAPHTPWLPTEEYVGKSSADLYGDFTHQVDAVVGNVLDALQRGGMTDNTLVIFTSDNGPVWYQEDVERLGHASVGPLRGMKGDLWEGGHRTPFIVRWPARVKPGTVSDQTICFTDVLPTLAALVGAKLDEDAAEDGLDLSPVLLGMTETIAPDRVLIHTQKNVLAVRRGPWKLIPQLGSAGFSEPKREEPVPGGPAGQLYNLSDDPGETTNLWLERPEIVRELSAILKAAK